ncbi:MAG TPA: hypothetical protein VKA26_13065 [Ignavibacteriaceae bacterium]|nr:hypothetical protein [Ignavibacteriaceae bacterium]
MNKKEKKNLTVCTWCNQPTNIIWVHGHGQCAVCETNIDECCRGENCEFPELNEKSKSREIDDK